MLETGIVEQINQLLGKKLDSLKKYDFLRKCAGNILVESLFSSDPKANMVATFEYYCKSRVL